MKTLLAAAAAIAVVTSSAAHAVATDDTTMGVSATVSRTCTVTADTLAFGTLTETGAKASSVISINCTAGSAEDEPAVTFSAGLNADGDTRRLIGGDSGTTPIPYTLASTEGGTNLTALAPVTATTTNGGINYSTTVYGSIDGGVYQIGSYTDTITVQVTYQDVVPAVAP